MSEQRMYPGMSPDERTTFAPYSAFDIPADLRELHGRYDVESTARRVRNFRYAEEWMMMMMGGWVATIPEVPVKTGLGKVIWESAQAADELGKRLPELRCGRKAVESSEASNEGFAAFVHELRSRRSTAWLTAIACARSVLVMGTTLKHGRRPVELRLRHSD